MYTFEFQQIILYLNWLDRTYILSFINRFKSTIKNKLARINKSNIFNKIIIIVVKINNKLHKQQYKQYNIK